METHDLGRACKGAKHKNDATVLAQMGDSFGTAASQIKIGNVVGVKDAQRIEALGRAVQVPVISGGRRRDEKQVLLLDPCGQIRGDFFVKFSHKP